MAQDEPTRRASLAEPPKQTTMVDPNMTDGAIREDWATVWARHLIGKWEHGDEKHRQWLRDTATADLAWALRHASHGRTAP